MADRTAAVFPMAAAVATCRAPEGKQGGCSPVSLAGRIRLPVRRVRQAPIRRA
jgi:hypothetical protein